MSVTLYHWEPNANSGKPMLTLAEKGVAYESRYLDLLQFDQHKPAYLAVNPDGTIPAMVHGSRVFTESTPMMEYIDDTFPGPKLKPQDPTARWRMRWTASSTASRAFSTASPKACVQLMSRSMVSSTEGNGSSACTLGSHGNWSALIAARDRPSSRTRCQYMASAA